MLKLFIALILLLAIGPADSQEAAPVDTNDPGRLWIEVRYGNDLIQEQQFSEARDVLSSTLEALENVYGKDSAELASTIILLSDATGALGKQRQQKKLHKRALKLVSARYGKSSTEYAHAKLAVGMSLMRFGGNSKAGLSSVEDAYTIYSQNPESSSQQFGDAALIVGNNYLARGKTEDAHRYYVRAHQVYSDMPDADEQRLAYAALNLAKTYLDQEYYEDAEFYYEQALDLLDADNPATQEDRLQAHAGLLVTYFLDGRSQTSGEPCVAIRALSADPSIPRAPPGKGAAPGQPINRVAPVYPASMIRLRKEGHVDFLFDVDEKGLVRSPSIIQVEGHTDFVAPAVKAVCRFTYSPKIVDGQPVATEGVKTRISFRFE